MHKPNLHRCIKSTRIIATRQPISMHHSNTFQRIRSTRIIESEQPVSMYQIYLYNQMKTIHITVSEVDGERSHSCRSEERSPAIELTVTAVLIMRSRLLLDWFPEDDFLRLFCCYDSNGCISVYLCHPHLILQPPTRHQGPCQLSLTHSCH